MNTQTDQAEVLFFTAPHCPTCKAMRPVATDVAAQFNGTVKFTEVNSASDPESPSQHRVRGVPTLIAFSGDTEVARAVGSHSPSAIESLFEAARSGRQLRMRISRADRAMRLTVAGLFAVAAAATATPALWVFAVLAAGFATWDLFRP